jgi:hypothetical protein
VTNTRDQFKPLSDNFEALLLEIESSEGPERRLELLQRMKALIDEIDELIFTPSDQQANDAHLTDADLTADSSIP